MAEGGGKKKKFPPGPWNLPLVGSLMSMSDLPFHLDLDRLSKKYGQIFSVSLGGSKLVVLNDYDSIKEAFVKNGKAFAGRPKDTRQMLVDKDNYQQKGITDCSYSDEWRNQRRLAMMILRDLGFGKTKSQALIQAECDALCAHLKSSGGKPHDPGPALNVTVANVICCLLLGERFSIKDQEFKDLLEGVETMLNGQAEETLGDYLATARMSSSYQKVVEKQAEGQAKLDKFFERKIESRWRKLSSRGFKDPSDFIECYLAEFEKISKKDAQKSGNTSADTNEYAIKEDWLFYLLNDFFLASTETTNVTLGWAFVFLAINQDVQAKIHEELDREFGTTDHRFEISDKPKTPYTEATIMEIQRRATVAATTLYHLTLEDVDLFDFHIPAGTSVIANLYPTLMDPNIWPEPEKLKPERFIGEDGKAFRHDKWIPFGMGQRSCLGEQLARQELYLFFSHLLHKFHISSPEGAEPPDLEPLEKLVLKPKPHKLCFKPRH